MLARREFGIEFVVRDAFRNYVVKIVVVKNGDFFGFGVYELCVVCEFGVCVFLICYECWFVVIFVDEDDGGINRMFYFV